MIEFMHKMTTILMEWLEPIGIISGLFFSGIALRNDHRSRRIQNHIKITEGYREIWSMVVDDPSLERVRFQNVNLASAPISPAEDRLVRFVFQNMMLAFEARNAGQLGNIGDFEKDVADFLTRSIPQAVWKDIARFQPDDFRKFVEGLM